MALPEESLHALTALSGVVLAQEDLRSSLDEVCRIAVRAVPAAEGASLTSFSDGRPSAVAASDDWARRLDELQYAEREGPCLDAARTGMVLRIRDLEDEPRWPSYVPRAAEQGARSMVSLPMAAEGKILGALNLYAREPEAFTAQEVSIGEVIAAHAGLASQAAASFFFHRDLGLQLRQAMQSRAVIEQAKGVLVASRRCGPDEAFEVLVHLSQTSNRKLRDVAALVVQEAAAGR
jgi:GAF domain-containing protein